MTARDDLLARVVDYVAEHGVGEASLRTIAEGAGTSHRMLLYHFRSREGLLAAVVETTWGRRQHQFAELLTQTGDPYVLADEFWRRLADEAAGFGPLFFEFAAAAMHRRQWADQMREWVGAWTRSLTELFVRAGYERDRAGELAHALLAITRGALFELCLTGNRPAADATIEQFLNSTKREARQR